MAGRLGEALDLRDLTRGSPGVTSEVGAYLAQAAAVCLEGQGHASDDTELRVTGTVQLSLQLAWEPCTEQARRAWADQVEAVEYGATGVAVQLVRRLHGHQVLERAIRGGGFDYWMGNEDGSLLQRKARLEVSGILHGTGGQVEARVREKRDQAARVGSPLPAHVVVVEFGCPRADAEFGGL